MNSPFKEPIRDSEDLFLRDVGVDVVFHGYRKSSGLQHCPGMAVPVVVVILQEHMWRHFNPMQRPELIV
jgi:hypothetical protein